MYEKGTKLVRFLTFFDPLRADEINYWSIFRNEYQIS